MIGILFNIRIIINVVFIILFTNDAVWFCLASTESTTEQRLPISSNDVSQSKIFYGNDVNYVPSRAVDGDEETCSKTTKYAPRWYNISINEEINLSRIDIIKKNDEDKFNVSVILTPRDSNETVEEFCVVQDIEILLEDRFNCSFSYTNPFVKTISITDYYEQLKELILCEVVVYNKISENRKELNLDSASILHDPQEVKIEGFNSLAYNLKPMFLSIVLGFSLLMKWSL